MNANAPDIIQEYKDVFGELGCLKGDHHINIGHTSDPPTSQDTDLANEETQS